MLVSQPLQTDLSCCADLASALDHVVHSFAAATGTIHILDSEGLLHLAASSGLAEGILERIRTLPVGKGMAGMAVERRQAVTIYSVQTDLSATVRPGARATELHRALALPIFRGEAVIGALGLGTAEERTFSESEIDALLEVGRAIAARFLGAPQSSAV
jgi:L-methionine (R)-S-oxide reductase